MHPLLQLAANLAVTTCLIADTGVHHDQAFSQAITSHQRQFQALVHNEDQAALVGRTSRIVAEQTCPHNFKRQWL